MRRQNRLARVSRGAIDKFGCGLVDLLADLRDSHGLRLGVPVITDDALEAIALSAINQVHGRPMYCVPDDVSFLSMGDVA